MSTAEPFAHAIASSRRVGAGPRFTPRPAGVLVERRGRLGDMSCRAFWPVASLVHIEVFAQDHVVVIPAGVGVAPPLTREGAYVLRGSCVYPLHTLEPTGLVLVGPGPTRTLGEFFALWGQPLGAHVLAGFMARRASHVSVFIDGVAWTGQPAAAPLLPHTQLTVEVGAAVPPHAHYLFPSMPPAR